MDVASLSDFAAIFELTFHDGVWKNTYLDKIRMPLPQLQEYVDKLIQVREPNFFKIDATGQGLQLSQFLQQKHGGKVIPIQMASKVDSQKIREYSAINLRTMMQEKKIIIQNDDDLLSHFSGWGVDLSSYTGEGHGDLAIAAELAALPVGKVPVQKNAPALSAYSGFARRF
jgi:hypothetical protein